MGLVLLVFGWLVEQKEFFSFLVYELNFRDLKEVKLVLLRLIGCSYNCQENLGNYGTNEQRMETVLRISIKIPIGWIEIRSVERYGKIKNRITDRLGLVPNGWMLWKN